jgi:competence protein ComEA
MSRRRPPRDVIDPTPHTDLDPSDPPDPRPGSDPADSFSHAVRSNLASDTADRTDPISRGTLHRRGFDTANVGPLGRGAGPDRGGPLGPGADPVDTDAAPLRAGTDVDPDPADVLARMRPATPRSWRERLDDLLVDVRRGPGLGAPATLAAGGLAAVVLALVVVVAWQVMAASAAAPEADLPRASGPTDTSMAAPAAAAPDPAAAPGSTASPSGVPEAGAVASTAAAGAPGGVSSGEVVVHVVGAVAAPGVQRLPAGARVTDAIEAAGGATADADLARVNLAATVTDGIQIVVPRPGEMVAPAAPVAPAGGSGSAGTSGAPDGGTPVNVNTAGAVELEELPGVGPATAAAIIAHRDEFGPFATVDQLIDVRGIGEVKLEQLRARATV